MFQQLGELIAKHWIGVILFWIILALVLRLAAPNWDSVTNDGDFAYLPDGLPSVRGEKLLSEAFPENRAKSQVVIVLAREGAPLSGDDRAVGYDVARRLHTILGVRLLKRAEDLRSDNASEIDRRKAIELLRLASESLVLAQDFDEYLVDYRLERNDGRALAKENRTPRTANLAAPYHWHSEVNRMLGEDEIAQQSAALAAEALEKAPDQTDFAFGSEWPVLAIWTPWQELLAEKFVSEDKEAMLLLMQLSTEFTATENIELLEELDEMVAQAQFDADLQTEPGLMVRYSGSAAVGGDMVRSARDSIRHTETVTIILVVIILLVVYRSPVLVFAPLLTIGVSLTVSTNLIALLTSLDVIPGFEWWSLKVFTTTKIFVVVILFGAGTDYCLFLISRYREELTRTTDASVAIARSLGGVGNALAASAFTTIVGLGMMIFADFGKFKYSGPVIGLSLFITLIVCLTFTPAILRGFGVITFWPLGVRRRRIKEDVEDYRGPIEYWWDSMAGRIVENPGAVLIMSLMLLTPIAWFGFAHSGSVSYDLAAGLPATAPSRQGAEIMKRHFEVGEGGPITLLLKTETADLETPAGRGEIANLTSELYLDGVVSVRSIADPLGDRLGGSNRRTGVSPGSVRDVAMRHHRLTEQVFLAQSPQLAGRVARFEIVLDNDPFSPEAAKTLSRIDDQVNKVKSRPDSYWSGSEHAYAGVTPAINDLRDVTTNDNLRIKVFVVFAVLGVLLVMLRRPLVCFYMIASVLFSYYITIGITEFYFHWLDGPDFVGLDWKAPLFLFVILVAIGQDYNVYLATRVFEEQEKFGPIEGLRRAISQTGGIITSCGVIMAGAFIAMTSGAWLPAGLGGDLGAPRAIVQLGFALSLGVIIDTFIVRPILLPAFLAMLARVKNL